MWCTLHIVLVAASDETDKELVVNDISRCSFNQGVVLEMPEEIEGSWLALLR